MRKKDPLIESFSAMASNYEELVDEELQKFWGWDYSSFVKTILDLTPVKEDDRILDIATGTAAIPIQLDRCSTQVVGLDLTYEMLVHAKEKIDKHKSNIELVCGSALSLPINGGVFDLATCVLASHHLDMRTLLTEMMRVLKKGGNITIADVCIPAYMRNPLVNFLLRIAAFLYFLPIHGIYRAKSESAAVSNVRTHDEWIQLSKEIGFRNITITKLKSKFAWLPGPLIMRATKMQR